MQSSQKRFNILIIILVILILIGLAVIGFLVHRINTMDKSNKITDTVYNIEQNSNIAENNNLANNNRDDNIKENNVRQDNNITNNTNNENSGKFNQNSTDEWELRLVNYDNSLPEDFEVELSSIDRTRQFDSRAIKYLNDMLLDMKEQNVKGIWVQSAYRSMESQTRVFNEEVEKQMKLRKIKRRSRNRNFKDNK